MSSVTLTVNGTRYGGWKEARVTRGIQAIAGGFQLAVSDRWAGQEEPWPILEEDACQLSLEDTPVISGYVDARSLMLGANEHTFAVTGRDKTGQLVDSSAVLDAWEFYGIPIEALAKIVAAPFGIPVRLQSGVQLPTAPVKLSINPGDLAFDVIERACRQIGMLPVSDGQGGLILTRAGSTRAKTALVEGENILNGAVNYDRTARFHRYVVTAQHPGTDEFFGAGVSDVEASATDNNVRLTSRVLLIRSETAATQEHAQQRANWEATVRAARAASFQVTVQGWTQDDGSLWPINAIVPLRSPSLGVNADMLIVQADHSVSDRDGTKTVLTLQSADAYAPEPMVPDDIWKLGPP